MKTPKQDKFLRLVVFKRLLVGLWLHTNEGTDGQSYNAHPISSGSRAGIRCRPDPDLPPIVCGSSRLCPDDNFDRPRWIPLPFFPWSIGNARKPHAESDQNTVHYTMLRPELARRDRNFFRRSKRIWDHTSNPYPSETPSSANSRRFRSNPPAYPTRDPSAPTTRWQGIKMGMGLRLLAMPTARKPRGQSTVRAISR